MYQVASSKAEEFIHDGEIVETLAYARENRANRPLIEAILQKAAEGKASAAQLFIRQCYNDVIKCSDK